MEKIIKIILIVIGVVLLLKMSYTFIKYVKGNDTKDKKSYIILGILYGTDIVFFESLYRLINSYLKNPGKSTPNIVLHSILVIYFSIAFLIFNSILCKIESKHFWKWLKNKCRRNMTKVN